MAKLTLSDITSTYASVTTINNNSQLIEAAIENTISRDGTSPNSMSANLDMGSNRVINLQAPVDSNDAVRLVDISGLLDTGTNLPSVSGNGGKFLRTDGSVTAWATPAASAISNTAAGNIVATDVQAAIDELDTEKAALAGATFTGTVKVDTLQSSGSVKVYQPVRYATTPTTASSTAVSFTSLPSHISILDVFFYGLSTSGTNDLIVRIGDATTGLVTTGYISSAFQATATTATATTSFILTADTLAAATYTGRFTIRLANEVGFVYVGDGLVQTPTGTIAQNTSVGSVTLSGKIDRLTFSTVGGTDTFDAGSIQLVWQ